MVSVGAAWAVWSMMRCNAGRWAGSTAVGWLLAGSQLALGGAGRGNDDGCGVGSTVVRSASGVVWSGIGVVAPVSTCVPASSVKSAAASGNSCVACSAPAGGRGGISAKGSVAVAAPAGENTTVRHRRYRPYCRRTRPWWEPQRLPRPRARWFGDYCGQRRRPRQKGASPPRLRQRSQPVVQPRLPRRTVPPARPANVGIQRIQGDGIQQLIRRATIPAIRVQCRTEGSQCAGR